MSSSLMVVASASLLLPSVLSSVSTGLEDNDNCVLLVSRITSIVLFILYFVYLVFQMWTHSSLFQAVELGEETHDLGPRASSLILLLATLGVTVCSDKLVDRIDGFVESANISRAFIGMIVVAIVGNAGEYVTTVKVATKDKLDLAIALVVGSTLQIALFVTPVMVIVGWIIGQPMSLRERSQQTYINSMLCGHFPTMSTLMGLFPVEYWANSSPYSTADDLLLDSNYGTADDLPDMRQTHIKLTWKQTIAGLVSHTPDTRATLQMDELGLARILHKVYLNMFQHENVQLLLSNLSLRTLSKHSMPRYHRGSFALILRFVRSRVSTNWNVMMGHLLELIEAEKTVMMGLNYIQELYLHLHLFDVFSVATLSSSPTQLYHPGKGQLRNWNHIPSIVCVTLVIPREKLKVITNVDTSEIESPIMHCLIQSSPSYDTHRWQNVFSVVQVSFGNLSGIGTQNTDSFQVSIMEDELRWRGSSSLIVSFLVPTWTLLLEPQTAKIAFGIQSSLPQLLHTLFGAPLGWR